MAPIPYTKRQLWPLALLLVAYPFGVALQNILCGIAFIAMLLMRGKYPASPALKQRTILAWSFILSMVVSGMMNPANPFRDFSGYIAGYLPWIILPLTAYVFRSSLKEDELGHLAKLLQVVVIVWGVVALSQSIWGWRLTEFTAPAHDMYRPRGFYSHPLSFAYAALLLWPITLRLAVKRSISGLAVPAAMANGLIIYLTESRTVQAVAALILIWTFLVALKGKARVWAMVGLFLTGVLVTVTENRVSQKFRNMLTEAGEDRQSDYPDDRLAFWAAHIEMIKERPLLGHGPNTNTAYRTSFYEKLGLGDFKKKYEAHNTFIQILAEGGIVGLALFLTTLLLSLKVIWGLGGTARMVGIQTWLAFVLGSLTQNTFQDSEVRFGLTLLLILLWLWPKRSEGSHAS